MKIELGKAKSHACQMRWAGFPFQTLLNIFNKLNYHLAKTNTVAGGAQLAFILLYKQYS